jgi:hypothetical protein
MLFSLAKKSYWILHFFRLRLMMQFRQKPRLTSCRFFWSEYASSVTAKEKDDELDKPDGSVKARK